MGYTCKDDGLIGVVQPPGMLLRNHPDSTSLQRLSLEHCECPDVAPSVCDEAEDARTESCVVDNVADAAQGFATAAAATVPCIANNFRESTPSDIPLFQRAVGCSESYGHPVDSECELAIDQMQEEIEADQEAPDHDPEDEEFHAHDINPIRPNLRQNVLPKTFPDDANGTFRE